jgi:hypothetical protein
VNQNCSSIRDTGDVYRNLVGKPLRRLRRKWESNIKMDLKKMGCDGERMMELAEDHVQGRTFLLQVLNLLVLIPEN